MGLRKSDVKEGEWRKRVGEQGGEAKRNEGGERGATVREDRKPTGKGPVTSALGLGERSGISRAGVSSSVYEL